MKAETYRRPILATVFYLASIAAIIGTVLLGILILSQPRSFDQTPFGVTGALVATLGAGGLTALLLWGAGQVFALLGRIEFNTRPASADAVLEHLRRIAANTQPVSPPALDDADPAVYYYREKDGTERGPLKRADLRALLTSGHITLRTRIDPEINGQRESDIAVGELLA